ncbi:hypothetical protein C1I89_22275 [Achromobacter pulmonis]|uniref:Uncharacterized protein n=1 Tax=Achromobacter pulmonis TaxID=1389932 RepID=A0A2N8KDQ6_9BURK|nr:hypothetical protein [Achromobacter pulmonis]PND31567.1 hypothetical protein C1I89_22275 [Achromobacter pulmonis]
MRNSFKVVVFALVAGILQSAGAVAYAAAAVPTEFPARSEIKPPANMPSDARAVWDKHQADSAKAASRTLKSSIVSDLDSLPVVERSFKPMQERIDQLAKARGTLPENLNSSWVIPADISRGLLGQCGLLQSTPSGVEVDGKLTGQIRVFSCADVGPVILSEELLSKGGMVNLTSADDVNVRISAGGIERGAIATRLVRPEDKEEMTMVRWRSGDKSITLRVAGTQKPSLDFVKKTVDGISD